MIKAPTEEQEQIALIRWFDLQMPSELKGKLVAIPNGGHRNKITGARLKLSGVRKGFPDMMLLKPSGGYFGLFIELKRTKGGSVSAEQIDWLHWLNQQGFMAAVCKGADEARKTIQDYLGRAA